MADSKIIVLRPDSPAHLNASLATISDGGAVTTIDYIGIKDSNTLNKTLTLGVNPNQTNQVFSLTMPANPGTTNQVLAIDSSGVDYAVLKFASNGNGTVTSITAGTGLTGGTITGSGTIGIANTAVTAGSYSFGSFTVGADGRITSASNGSAVTSITAGTGLTGGTITGSGTIGIANTAVTAGSYTKANITVGTDGRITSASNGSSGMVSGTGTLTINLVGQIFPAFTVNNAAITTNSVITFTRIGAITNASTIGELTISSQTAGSFTVQSTVNTDVGQIKWAIFN